MPASSYTSHASAIVATGPWQSEALAVPQCFVLCAGAMAHALSIAEGMTIENVGNVFGETAAQQVVREVSAYS